MKCLLAIAQVDRLHFGNRQGLVGVPTGEGQGGWITLPVDALFELIKRKKALSVKRYLAKNPPNFLQDKQLSFSRLLLCVG
jgi:hypothetical protein